MSSTEEALDPTELAERLRTQQARLMWIVVIPFVGIVGRVRVMNESLTFDVRAVHLVHLFIEPTDVSAAAGILLPDSRRGPRRP